MASMLLEYKNYSFLFSHPRRSTLRGGEVRRAFLRKAPSFFLFGLTAAFVVLYMLLTNSVVSDVYKMSEQEGVLNTFQEENRLLDIEFARVNSYSHLVERSQELNMVDVGEVVHLTISEGSLARIETP